MTEYETRYLAHYDREEGITYEPVVIETVVEGEEDIEESTYKAQALVATLGEVATAASALGLPGDAVASFVEGFAMTDAGVANMKKAEDAVLGLVDATADADSVFDRLLAGLAGRFR